MSAGGIARRALVLAVPIVASANACDDRQAWHVPDPTLARMLAQPKADPYESTLAFRDGKTMRDPPTGTIARDDDDDGAAPPVTRASLTAGRARFGQLCAACHGVVGDGVSVVATKMRRAPPSLHDAKYRAFTREQLFEVVTRGYGLMPSYADVMGAEDRWATVAYVRALQLSRHADVTTLPPEVRAELAMEAP